MIPQQGHHSHAEPSLLVAPEPSAKSSLDTLVQTILSDCKEANWSPIPVPERYQWRGESRGQAIQINAHVFESDTIAWGRVVRVDGGDTIQVLNVVALPRTTSRASIFGCELLVFRKGLHLFVLDAFPTTPTDTPDIQQLRQIQQELNDSFNLEETPEWGKNVFSPNVVILKPGARLQLPVQAVVPAFQKLWTTWMNQLPHSSTINLEEQVQIRELRARYLHHHAHDEPAGPFLQRMAGEEWAHDFIHSFLFPQWLKEGDASPPWDGL